MQVLTVSLSVCFASMTIDNEDEPRVYLSLVLTTGMNLTYFKFSKSNLNINTKKIINTLRYIVNYIWK